MDKNRVIVIGDKESFIVKVLIKKTCEAGLECSFARWDINAINDAWQDDVGLITLYMGEGDVPPGEVLRFLNDKLADVGDKMVLIGSDEEMNHVLDRIPGDLIYKAFRRPVSNEEYVGAVTELFSKIQAGEFLKTVLIVDDDPGYLGLVREWLKGRYKVAMANSGTQAIKWFGKHKADLILLDYEMPVTTGPQVLEMLRHDDDTKNVPVIFLTGRSDKQSVMTVLELKPEGYFLKTIEKEELLEKLDNFFASRKKSSKN